ncbi:hypothetical protein CDAR_308861 [Caerostris darwini]|uniref:Uncharacterized protein n=1 Tax=Caerostris darwini TaxID=1538125 RepID=A0AAV4Q632_9ARAC|nr:hypothetical protein CDAR_308861 [Caerostris darwini]
MARETESATIVIGELTASDYGCRAGLHAQPSAIYHKLLIHRIETLNYVDELPAKLTEDADLLSWKRVHQQSSLRESQRNRTCDNCDRRIDDVRLRLQRCGGVTSHTLKN